MLAAAHASADQTMQTTQSGRVPGCRHLRDEPAISVIKTFHVVIVPRVQVLPPASELARVWISRYLNVVIEKNIPIMSIAQLSAGSNLTIANHIIFVGPYFTGEHVFIPHDEQLGDSFGP